MKTEEEITQLAKDIYAGQVFCSWNIREGDHVFIENIFMPIAFMSNEQLASFRAEEPHLIYEYISKAGPRSINGYPVFMSLQRLNKQEFEMLLEKYNKIEKAMKEI